MKHLPSVALVLFLIGLCIGFYQDIGTTREAYVMTSTMAAKLAATAFLLMGASWLAGHISGKR